MHKNLAARMTGALALAIISAVLVSGFASAAAACTTSAATGIKDTAATLHGQATGYTPGSTINTVGFLWGTSPTLVGATNTSLGAKTADPTGKYNLTLTVSSLHMQTTYYFRAWSIQTGAVKLGSIRSFTTTLFQSSFSTLPGMLTSFLVLAVLMLAIVFVFAYLFGIFGTVEGRLKPGGGK